MQFTRKTPFCVDMTRFPSADRKYLLCCETDAEDTSCETSTLRQCMSTGTRERESNGPIGSKVRFQLLYEEGEVFVLEVAALLVKVERHKPIRLNQEKDM